jgi:hypothetical protein
MNIADKISKWEKKRRLRDPDHLLALLMDANSLLINVTDGKVVGPESQAESWHDAYVKFRNRFHKSLGAKV